MPPDRFDRVPGFADDSLRTTFQGSYGAGADAGLPADVRFLVGVVRAVRNRLRRTEADAEVNPTIFLMASTSEASLDDDATRRTVYLLDQGNVPLQGHVWFANAAVMRADGIEFAHWDNEAVIGTVLDQWQVGHAPAVLFDPRNDVRQIRFYPQGLHDTDQCDVRLLDASTISLDDIFEVIDKIHERVLVTGAGQSPAMRVWKDMDQHIPQREVEGLVQDHLRVGLTGAFLSCIVREEQPGPLGRYDIAIEVPSPVDPDGFVCFAILELKVVKSFTSGGKPVPDGEAAKWIASGVEQAHTYRSERSAKEAALCCFDMRKPPLGEDMFGDEVKREASKLNVRLGGWHLFPTPDDYRNAAREGRRATAPSATSEDE